MASRLAPRRLFERPKTGFGIPVGDWIKGPLRDWAEAMLDESRLREEGFFEPAPVRRRWAEHLAGRANHTSSLWSILMFQAWHEAATDKGAPAERPARAAAAV